jgi:hypothetical protein
MGNFTVYGYIYGSVDLAEVVAYADSYEDAQMAVELATGFDFYAIAMDVGGVRFATYA